MKRKLFEFATAPITALFKQANAATVSVAERINPIYQIDLPPMGKLKFYCPNNLSLWRAKTLFDKEPDTIEWINSFAPDTIFYDIGANVGMFSIYAAAKGARVYAFEPESQNYAVLNRNIYLNQLQDNVNAYNIALNSKSCIDMLYIKEFTIGGALNNFGESINYKKEQFTPGFKQAVASFRLDDLITQHQLPIPDHIKIDVDGLEPAVIAGSDYLLRQPKLKSLLIELNTQLTADNALIDQIQDYGFKFMSRYRSPNFANSEFKDIYNHIFSRGT